MDIASCYQLGYITKPHGLKGDVSIVIDADFPEDYKNLESVFIERDKQLVPFFIRKIKLSRDKAILQLEESDSIETASALKGAGLYLPLSSLPELADDQFYFHEIIGFLVEDEMKGIVGKVIAVYDVGPQDLLAIDHNGTEVLLPINDETVIRTDKANKIVKVRMPEGLLEVYLNENKDEN